ncbi:MAG: OsmC family protein [Nitrospiraceae bacterium]|nr:OsmC family protein [Nitrospiraceae bacterium]
MDLELNVTVGDLKGKMQLTGKGHSGHEVAIDYTPPMGDDQGFTSLELLLVSLASCSGHTVQFLLGKMGKKVEKLDVKVKGKRRMDEHPTMVTHAHICYALKGEGLDKESVEKAVKMAEEKFCPVWAMLRNNVTVTWECSVE